MGQFLWEQKLMNSEGTREHKLPLLWPAIGVMICLLWHAAGAPSVIAFERTHNSCFSSCVFVTNRWMCNMEKLLYTTWFERRNSWEKALREDYCWNWLVQSMLQMGETPCMMKWWQLTRGTMPSTDIHPPYGAPEEQLMMSPQAHHVSLVHSAWRLYQYTLSITTKQAWAQNFVFWVDWRNQQTRWFQ